MAYGLEERYSNTDLKLDLEYFNNPDIQNIGGDMAGIFNIPIARCNAGECISGGEGDGHTYLQDRNYPCLVGDYSSWWPIGDPDGEVSCSGTLKGPRRRSADFIASNTISPKRQVYGLKNRSHGGAIKKLIAK
jgi:hypothetical protein